MNIAGPTIESSIKQTSAMCVMLFVISCAVKFRALFLVDQNLSLHYKAVVVLASLWCSQVLQQKDNLPVFCFISISANPGI